MSIHFYIFKHNKVINVRCAIIKPKEINSGELTREARRKITTALLKHRKKENIDLLDLYSQFTTLCMITVNLENLSID